MFDIIFRGIPSKIILRMKKNDRDIIASDIAKDINCTYSHLSVLIKRMEENELIFSEKHGRCNILTLTKKGQSIVFHIEEIKRILKV